MNTSSNHQLTNNLCGITGLKRNTQLLLIVLCALVLSLSSCGESTTGGINGNGYGNENGNENGNGEEIGLEPTFTNVVQIFQAHCAPCHISDTVSGVRLNNYDNVMGSEGDQYESNVVLPNNADNSPLVDKIEPNPQYGARMPEGGPFLSNDRINQIKQWINDGAEDN
jgi:hypothetical protein